MAPKHDSRPLYARRQSVELRIAALEKEVAAAEHALSAARDRHTEIMREVERADTIPAPPPANDNACELEVDWVGIL